MIDLRNRIKIIEPAVYPPFIKEATLYSTLLDDYVGQEFLCEDIKIEGIGWIKKPKLMYCLIKGSGSQFTFVDVSNPREVYADASRYLTVSPIFTLTSGILLHDFSAAKGQLFGALVYVPGVPLDQSKLGITAEDPDNPDYFRAAIDDRGTISTYWGTAPIPPPPTPVPDPPAPPSPQPEPDKPADIYYNDMDHDTTYTGKLVAIRKQNTYDGNNLKDRYDQWGNWMTTTTPLNYNDFIWDSRARLVYPLSNLLEFFWVRLENIGYDAIYSALKGTLMECSVGLVNYLNYLQIGSLGALRNSFVLTFSCKGNQSDADGKRVMWSINYMDHNDSETFRLNNDIWVWQGAMGTNTFQLNPSASVSPISYDLSGLIDEDTGVDINPGGSWKWGTPLGNASYATQVDATNHDSDIIGWANRELVPGLVDDIEATWGTPSQIGDDWMMCHPAVAFGVDAPNGNYVYFEYSWPGNTYKASPNHTYRMERIGKTMLVENIAEGQTFLGNILTDSQYENSTIDDFRTTILNLFEDGSKGATPYLHLDMILGIPKAILEILTFEDICKMFGTATAGASANYKGKMTYEYLKIEEVAQGNHFELVCDMDLTWTRLDDDSGELLCNFVLSNMFMALPPQRDQQYVLKFKKVGNASPTFEPTSEKYDSTYVGYESDPVVSEIQLNFPFMPAMTIVTNFASDGIQLEKLGDWLLYSGSVLMTWRGNYDLRRKWANNISANAMTSN